MHEVKIFTVHKNLSSKKILFSFRVERYINIKEPLRQGEFIIVYNQNDEARIASLCRTMDFVFSKNLLKIKSNGLGRSTQILH